MQSISPSTGLKSFSSALNTFKTKQQQQKKNVCKLGILEAEDTCIPS